MHLFLKYQYLEVSDNIRTVFFKNCYWDRDLHKIVKPLGPGCPESLFLALVVG